MCHVQVHLFDIDIPGGVTFRESETLTAGTTGTVVDTDAGRLGVGICYDIRFPELAITYAQRGAQLIVYPGESSLSPLPGSLYAKDGAGAGHLKTRHLCCLKPPNVA